MSKFPVLSISLFSANLARLHTEKFLVLPTKSWNDTNTCSKFTTFLDDKIRATVQLITYTVPQNCLSLFTIHIRNCSIFVHFSSEAELQIFFLEGHHLSKIRLGANVRFVKQYLASFCCRSHSQNNSYPSKCSSELNPNPTSICTHTIHLFQL